MNVEEYRAVLHDDIELLTQSDNSNAHDEFLRYAISILVNGEEFDDFVECHFDGLNRRNGSMRIDGYSMDETDGSCCVILSDYHGPRADDSVKGEDVNAAFKC